MKNAADRRQHFAIRKLTVGAASVLLGTTLWLGTNASTAHADVADGILNLKHMKQAILKLITVQVQLKKL